LGSAGSRELRINRRKNKSVLLFPRAQGLPHVLFLILSPSWGWTSIKEGVLFFLQVSGQLRQQNFRCCDSALPWLPPASRWSSTPCPSPHSQALLLGARVWSQTKPRGFNVPLLTSFTMTMGRLRASLQKGGKNDGAMSTSWVWWAPHENTEDAGTIWRPLTTCPWKSPANLVGWILLSPLAASFPKLPLLL
jgi:hypothetical protein